MHLGWASTKPDGIGQVPQFGWDYPLLVVIIYWNLMIHFRSLSEAKEYINSLRGTSDTVGSVHTLGSLHRAHAELIRHSVDENDITIVTIYPNRIQLFPGHIYQYNLEEDAELAANAGAQVLISSVDKEMFPSGYITFINQGEAHSRLNSSIFPFATKGQVTGSLRWLNFCQPDRSYFGLKDIEQAILVKRAVQDLLMPVDIRFVPCVRFAGGVPVSSRLRNVDSDRLNEIAAAYQYMITVLQQIRSGETNVPTILSVLEEGLRRRLYRFKLRYVDAVNEALTSLEKLELPFVLHYCISDEDITIFDGIWIRNKTELENGPSVIWLD